MPKIEYSSNAKTEDTNILGDIPPDQLICLRVLADNCYRAPFSVGRDLADQSRSRQWAHWRLKMLLAQGLVERRKCYYVGRFFWEYHITRAGQAKLQEQIPTESSSTPA